MRRSPAIILQGAGSWPAIFSKMALGYDFRTGSLRPMYGDPDLGTPTFARTGVRGYRSSAAAYALAADSAPRFHYAQPAGAQPLGLLIENGITQEAPNTNTVGGTGWTNTSVTVTGSDVAPDGSNDANVLNDASGAVTGFTTTGALATASFDNVWGGVFFKKTSADTNYARIEAYTNTGATTFGATFNTNTGAVSASSGAGVLTFVEDWGAYWRVSVGGLRVGTTGETRVYPAFNSDGTNTPNVATTGSKTVWGGDNVSDHSALPLMHLRNTTGADLVSPAETCQLTLPTGVYNAQQGSLVAVYYNPSTTSQTAPTRKDVCEAGIDANQKIRFSLIGNSTTMFGKVFTTGGAGVFVASNSSNVTPGARSKVGIGWANANYDFQKDASAVVTQSSGALSFAATTLFFGHDEAGANQLNQVLEQLYLFRTKLTDTELTNFMGTL